MIADLLGERIGLKVEALGEERLRSDIARRMRLANIDNEDEYLRMLDSSALEFDALVEELVVPETSFLRYPGSFSLLAATAAGRLPRIRKEGRPFRVLSAPCSTGEEPYSIAATLLEIGMKPLDFTIDAVDISAAALAKAEAGAYDEYSFRGVDEEFKEHHFSRRDERYHVRPELRERVFFRRVNLLESGALAAAAPYDAIFCRNLIIYLDSEPRRRLFATIIGKLALDGLLFLGHAEAMTLAGNGFSQVGDVGAFAFAQGAKRQVGDVPRRPRPAPAANADRAIGKPSLQPLVKPPPAIVAKPPPPAAGQRGANPLAAARRAADHGDIDTAETMCLDYLGRAQLDGDAHCLLGVIKLCRNDLKAAAASLRRCLYLDPLHSEALGHLAMISEALGDASGATRLRRRLAKSASNHLNLQTAG